MYAVRARSALVMRLRLLAAVAAQQRDDESGRATGQDLPVPARRLPPSQGLQRRLLHAFEDPTWSSRRVLPRCVQIGGPPWVDLRARQDEPLGRVCDIPQVGQFDNV
jgi:hypothetical protein